MALPSLPYVRQCLGGGRMPAELLEPWLRDSWRDRTRFRHALYSTTASVGYGSIKSRPDRGIDFYADCITRHVGSQHAALIAASSGTSEHTSYEQLHERCSALVSTWSRADVTAGDTVAIVLAVGPDFAVALLTALRLGLIVTIVPPLGPAYVRARLAYACVDHVVTSERLAHLLAPGSCAPLPIRAQRGDTTASSSHTYAPSDTALRLFSPFGERALCEPHELSAAELHASLLCDASLVFGLSPQDRLAMPAADPLQWQPHALLCAWLAGATFVELDLPQVAASPQSIAELGVSVLGVESCLRDLALARGIDLGRGPRAWFRNLDDVFDYPRWQQLDASFAAHDVPGFAVLCNAASGGIQLFSQRARGNATVCVWPAPGREHVVTQVGAHLLPAQDETGVYVALRAGEPDPSLVRAVIAKLEWGWTLGGNIDIGPRGRALPLAEIAACAERQAGVDAASVVVTPGRWPNSAHTTLLMFTADPSAVADLSTSAWRTQLRYELGDVHTPERFEILSLHPRRKQHVLQTGWCAAQYASGMLGRKARTPAFQTMSRLGWIFELPPNNTKPAE